MNAPYVITIAYRTRESVAYRISVSADMSYLRVIDSTDAGNCTSIAQMLWRKLEQEGMVMVSRYPCLSDAVECSPE